MLVCRLLVDSFLYGFHFPTHIVLKQEDDFAITSQLCFSICYQEGPKVSGGFGIK
jgi:hypothetical protein